MKTYSWAISSHPACHIAIGKGFVALPFHLMTQRVKDVHQFPGHIACDANSQSEIVIPLHQNGKIIGVLDIDAPIKTDFHKMIKKDLNVKTLENNSIKFKKS